MKAILVIDMPKDCTACDQFGFGVCYTMRREVGMENITLSERPSWCPLKPVHFIKCAGRDYIIYERQYLYKNLEREFDLLMKAREFDESNSTDR